MFGSFKQSPLLKEAFHWPGSTILNQIAKPVPISANCKLEELVKWIKQEKIDLTVCGPEKPLADGLADLMQAEGLQIIGPNKAAARLEASKTFAKKLMMKANIPTSRYHETKSPEEAWQKCQKEIKASSGVVIKVDGLASGKGVFVCHSEKEAKDSLEKIKQLFPEAQNSLLVEELLKGREFSYFALINKSFHISLGSAVDFKRRDNQDQGPNTGGMGTYTPVPWLPFDPAQHIDDKIIAPLMNQLEKEGLHYTGILYCGLMLTDDGIKVIEFNVRLGDPEAQVLAVNDHRDWLALFLESLEKEKGFKGISHQKQKRLEWL